MLDELVEAFMKTELDIIAMDAATSSSSSLVVEGVEGEEETINSIVQNCVSEMISTNSSSSLGTSSSPSYQFIRSIIHETSIQLRSSIQTQSSSASEEGENKQTSSTSTNTKQSFSLFEMMDQQGYAFQKRITATDILNTYNNNHRSLDEFITSLEDVEDIDD
eukprot:935364-Ditylum_brightwellii.AAC.1